MRSDATQPDLIRHCDRSMAAAFRAAADTARRNPFEPPDIAEQRAAYYEAQAEKYERT